MKIERHKLRVMLTLRCLNTTNSNINSRLVAMTLPWQTGRVSPSTGTGHERTSTRASPEEWDTNQSSKRLAADTCWSSTINKHSLRDPAAKSNQICLPPALLKLDACDNNPYILTYVQYTYTIKYIIMKSYLYFYSALIQNSWSWTWWVESGWLIYRCLGMTMQFHWSMDQKCFNTVQKEKMVAWNCLFQLSATSL